MSLLIWLRVAVVLPLVVINTLVHAVPLFVAALLKAVLPGKRLKRMCDRLLTGLAESWIGVNTLMLGWFTPTRFQVQVPPGLQVDGHYLVLANHQSWVDILVLQKVFNRRIPLLRFFLKRQLFWVPVLGLAWWALDFPFMGRYTHRQVARNPELARRDTEAVRRACLKFRDIPVAMMNFVEGTRFTPEKHARQDAPYRHLLKPRSGGVAFVLDAMGEGLHAILDVSIAYPGGRPTMVDLMAGRVPEVRVLVRERPIPEAFMVGNYQQDRAFRARFQQWLNGLWEEKDVDLGRLMEHGSAE
ncbi:MULTISPECIES: acyltransferase [unclassified Luteimonas]